MLKLLNVCVFSLFVSFAAFSNQDVQSMGNDDTQSLELGQNQDQFLIDTVKSVVSGIKNLGSKVISGISSILGGGSIDCGEIKDQLKAAGYEKKSDQKAALQASIDAGECGGDCKGYGDIIKKCY
ncbi:MAG: hypothetical protein KC505_09655 [Myxococcales bacterium]|nr:hypothetical protein [Myxococcales bacterium]USN50003.1 MAG: hypothetical protein H6731_06935 [Myxococcales bacterium]